MMKSQKHLFSLKEGVHYLNCAFKNPLLKSAETAAINALKAARNPMHLTPEDFYSGQEEVRELFGKLVNCKPSEVAIIPSVSYGLSSVLNNIDCKEGQHALTIENEFPSDYFAIERWCRDHKASLKISRPGKEKLTGKSWNEDILNSIDEKTAVVIISSIHWMNGLKFDLQKIGDKCREVGAKFIVDGTQSVGACPMDVVKLKVDALFCAGYKWLMGPYSLSVAYIGNTFNEGSPLEESWMNRTNAADFSNLTNYDPVYSPDAGRYNVGQSSNFILIPMLIESLRQLHQWTIPAIEAYCGELMQPLISYLQELGVEMEHDHYLSNHLFGLKLPEGLDGDLLKEKLAQNKVYLSVRGSSLRVSVNVFNTKEDIDQLIATIEETRKVLPSA